MTETRFVVIESRFPVVPESFLAFLPNSEFPLTICECDRTDDVQHLCYTGGYVNVKSLIHSQTA